MVSKRVLIITNLSLGLIVLLLLLNLLGVKLPVLGKSFQQLEPESVCVMKTWEGDFVERNILDCCQEKRALVLNCQKQTLYYTDKTLSRTCFTGNQIEYYFNEPAYSYCQKII